MSGYDPKVVSNNILQRAFRDNMNVTPMKLQKILYFAASEYAKRTGKKMLTDDFEAWQYGPVVKDVFHYFKSFSGRPITSYSVDSAGKSFVINESDNPVLHQVLDDVWEKTRWRSATNLSQITHTEGSAWHQVYTGWGEVIPEEQIAADETYVGALGLR